MRGKKSKSLLYKNARNAVAARTEHRRIQGATSARNGVIFSETNLKERRVARCRWYRDCSCYQVAAEFAQSRSRHDRRCT